MRIDLHELIRSQKLLSAVELLLAVAFLGAAVVGRRPYPASVALALLVPAIGMGLLVALQALGRMGSPWSLPTGLLFVASIPLSVQALIWWIWPSDRALENLTISLLAAPVVLGAAYLLLRRKL